MDNTNTLSRSAQNIQNVLLKSGLTMKVLELSSSTRTALEAAESLGCEVSQIVKSLIFKTQSTHKPILVLASGPNCVNERTLEEYVGEKISKADAVFTKDVTGFAIGGIPPIGHKQPIETYIDEDLLKFNTLWAAAGTPHAVFSIHGVDLLNLTNGKVVCIF
jgi:prolyl-tRNA editing enzyme YbaK/EbsC (Cys-tRNA(Pro) deacylase)